MGNHKARITIKILRKRFLMNNSFIKKNKINAGHTKKLTGILSLSALLSYCCSLLVSNIQQC